MTIFAAVLSGGLSSRMGQDKASLTLQGRTLLERAQRLLLDAGADEVLVSGASRTPNAIPDLIPQCGPPGALYALLDSLKARGALDGSPLILIPVDMPLLRAETVHRLLEHAMPKASGYAKPGVPSVGRPVLCCHYENEVFPCVIPATEALHQHLQSLFADELKPGGKRSMKAIIGWLDGRACKVGDIDPDEFLNANTPEQLAQVIIRLGLRQSRNKT